MFEALIDLMNDEIMRIISLFQYGFMWVVMQSQNELNLHSEMDVIYTDFYRLRHCFNSKFYKVSIHCSLLACELSLTSVGHQK